jgi:hypothetical protein
MAKARFFGDLDDPDSRVSKLIRERGGFQLCPAACTRSAERKTEAEVDPAVYYLPS